MDTELAVLCLEIVASCLKHMPDDTTAILFSRREVLPQLMEILKAESFEERAQDLALEIIDKLSEYKIVHEDLLAQGLILYLGEKLGGFVEKKVKGLSLGTLKELARILQICANLSRNIQLAARIQHNNLLEKLIFIYASNSDITFLRDAVIRALLDITKSHEGAMIIERANINFRDMIYSALESQNPALVDAVEIIVKNIASEGIIVRAIDAVTRDSSDDKGVVFLSYLSINEKHKILFENQALLNLICSILKRQSNTKETTLGIMKIFKELIKINAKYVDLFVTNAGLNVASQAMADPGNYLLLIEIFELFVEALKSSKNAFAKVLSENGILNKALAIYDVLAGKYEEFSLNALTLEKAEDAIEYHKSEVTKALLLTRKDIVAKEVVTLKLALEYTACEALTVKLLDFLKTNCDYGLTINTSNSFLSTCNLSLKVFRNSKTLHEQLFDTLRRLIFTTQNTEHIMALNWPFQLSNVIWKNPDWKHFALYVLRFIEVLMADPANIKLMTQGVNTIKLVSSIRHFITDEDIKDFNEKDLGQTSDVLTYNEEREIYRKGAQLLEKLIDTSVLQTFQNNIGKGLQKFTPRPEVITILRAEYAVLAVVNGINYFGCEGLNGNMHIWLENNIKQIETVCKGQDFPDKEKLIADCIRSLANYVCITWNDNGKHAYEAKEISVIVFKLFERYLKTSKRPLYSYVLLKAFKEWLVNRIETIEKVSNADRERIYDRESFMMVPMAKRDKIMTDVLDALYLTHTNFSSVEKVVGLNFEVIMLLSYMYPEWKSRAAKNFIPQIINIIGSSAFAKDMDHQMIALLKSMTGTDDASETVNLDTLQVAAENGALDRICLSIAKKNFDPVYVAECRPLLEQLGKNDAYIDASIEVIDRLLKEIRETPIKEGHIDDLSKAVNQLNLLCTIPALRDSAAEKGHVEALVSRWADLNALVVQGDQKTKQALSGLERGFIIGIREQLEEATNQNNQDKIVGKHLEDKSLVRCALQSIQNNRDEPEIVKLNARIVNQCFSDITEAVIIQLVKQMSFQPDLEYVHNAYTQNEDKQLANEVETLYLNLSKDQDDRRTEKTLQGILRDLDVALRDNNSIEALSALTKLKPFTLQQIFGDKFEELDIAGYLLKVLKHLNEQVQGKTGKKPAELVSECLHSQHIPDIGPHNRKLLEDDISLANNLMILIKGLHEDVKQKVRSNKDVVTQSSVLLVLNSKPEGLDLYADYCKDNGNIKLLSNLGSIEIGVYVLMRNNKDSFKYQDIEAPQLFGKSATSVMLKQSALSKSLVSAKDAKISQTNIKPADRNTNFDDGKAALLEKNLDTFNSAIPKLYTSASIKDIIERYIKAMQEAKPKDDSSISEAIYSSRMMLALLKSTSNWNMEPFAARLKAVFIGYLSNMNPGPVSKLLLKFFEQIFGKIAKQLATTSVPLSSEDIWSSMLELYLINNPGVIKNNPKRIFKNLVLAQPPVTSPNNPVHLFHEPSGILQTELRLTKNGPLSTLAVGSASKIIANIQKAVDQCGLQPYQFAPAVEYLSRSKAFSQAMLDTTLFDTICSHIVFYEDHSNPHLFKALTFTLINIVASIKEEPKLVYTFKKKLHADNILYSFFDNIEFDRSDFVEDSIKACIFLFDILDNRSHFHAKNLPMKLLEHLGPLNEWSGKPEAVMLLAKMLEDPSLEKIITEANVPSFVQVVLRDQLQPADSPIKNPNKYPFDALSEVSTDKNQLFCQLTAYMLGEFSKYDHHALAYLDKSKKLPSLFDIYNLFERYDNDAVIATKTIETVRNAVVKVNEAYYRANLKNVQDILARIPSKLKKFKTCQLISVYLQEILDHFQNFEDKSLANSFLGRLTRSVVSNMDDERAKKERLKDVGGLTSIYKEMSEKLVTGPLTKEDAQTLGMARMEIQKLLIADPNSAYTFSNLNLPRYLRQIANAKHSTMGQKLESLELLNRLSANEDVKSKLLVENYYVISSCQLVDEIKTSIKSFKIVDPATLETLKQDLVFLRSMTDNTEGVEHAFDSIRMGIPLIDQLFSILKSDSHDEGLKASALDILTNLLNHGKEKGLQKKVISELPSLMDFNTDLYTIITPLTKLVGVLASKSDVFKKRMVEFNVPAKLQQALKRFPTKPVLQNNVAFAIFELSNEYPDSHASIFQSGVLPLMSSTFKDTHNDQELHRNAAKTLLQLSFKNNEKKAELVRLGFSQGLIPLLVHYSSPEHLDEDICTLLLKCMANFSSIPAGAAELLEDGAMQAFRAFFNAYKDDLPDHVRFMMCTVSNLAFEPQDGRISKMIEDKGIELIIESLSYHAQKRDPDTTEICIDSLAHASNSSKSLAYLNKTAAIEALVDLLRQQINDRLCYKALRCLTNFCNDPSLADRFMEKGGYKAVVDALPVYRADLKNIYQSIKMLNFLIDKFPDQKESFVFAGVPDKVMPVFDPTWP